jgi:hypothetical protein
MNSTLHVNLNTSPEQVTRLDALQTAFAEVCSALAPVVQQTRCWNRVTLHHLAYRALRDRFPHLGSQMVCNAIYSVSRTCRIVFQHPGSPWNIAKLGNRPLPRLRFLPTSPVYFDRHTLSLKDGRLSMYTLDGRMRFQLELKAEDEARFHQEKLREIVLEKTPPGGFQLSFHFSPEQEADSASTPVDETSAELPEYVLVKDAAAPDILLQEAAAAKDMGSVAPVQ